ncbi:MAG: hypothetical protein II940_05115, partial [Methanosarcinaceae archaeon]|nr:hypothetical protein [Methanosarcinaceae archaeon]
TSISCTDVRPRQSYVPGRTGEVSSGMICGIMVYADYRVNQEIGLNLKILPVVREKRWMDA